MDLSTFRLSLREIFVVVTVSALSACALAQASKFTLCVVEGAVFASLVAAVIGCVSSNKRIRCFCGAFFAVCLLHYVWSCADQFLGQDEILEAFPTNIGFRLVKGEIQWDDGSGPSFVFPGWRRDYFAKQIATLVVSVHLGLLAGYLARSVATLPSAEPANARGDW
jgi:hypothetical protein